MRETGRERKQEGESRSFVSIPHSDIPAPGILCKWSILTVYTNICTTRKSKKWRAWLHECNLDEPKLTIKLDSAKSLQDLLHIPLSFSPSAPWFYFASPLVRSSLEPGTGWHFFFTDKIIMNTQTTVRSGRVGLAQ